MNLFESALTVSLVVLCALGATTLLRKQSAALRHWLLAAAIACGLAVPLIQAVAPSWRLPRSAPAAIGDLATFRVRAPDASPRLAAPEIPASASPVDVAALIVPLWMAGAGISLAVLLIAMIRLHRIASRSTRVGDPLWIDILESAARDQGLRRPVFLLQSDHPTLLVTWGFRHARVILPAVARDWSDDRIRIVLCHELAHIARWDWASQMLGELLRSIYWFNPLLWIACRRLRRESEHACDDAVLTLGVEGPDYATHLLDLARALRHQHRWLPVPAMASPSNLERRIRAMLDSRHSRQGITRSTRLATLLGLLTITVLLAGFGAAAQTFSTVSGSIVDSQGALLPDARLVLANVQTKAKYEVRSNATGQFEFLGVTPGDYLLQAVVAGFKSFQENVSVVGGNLRRDISMNVGTLEETITVTGGPERTRSADEIREAERRNEVFGQQARLRFQQALAACKASDAPAGAAIGGKIRPPRKVRDVRPQYPESLRSAGIGGIVKLLAVIGTEGLITQVRSVDPSAHPALVDAAVEAVKQWEFQETLLNCVPIEVEMTVSVSFQQP